MLKTTYLFTGDIQTAAHNVNLSQSVPNKLIKLKVAARDVGCFASYFDSAGFLCFDTGNLRSLASLLRVLPRHH